MNPCENSPAKPSRIIGHPDLASGASCTRGDTRYVSVLEAIYMQSQGKEVEIHLHPTREDEEALAGLRERARNRWEGDRLPDFWTRPLHILPPPPVSRVQHKGKRKKAR